MMHAKVDEGFGGHHAANKKAGQGMVDLDMTAFWIQVAKAYHLYNQRRKDMFNNTQERNDIAGEYSYGNIESLAVGDAYLFLGQMHFSLENYENAIVYIKKCLEFRNELPDNTLVAAYETLGLAYCQKKQTKDAILCCKKVIEIANESVGKFINFACNAYDLQIQLCGDQRETCIISLCREFLDFSKRNDIRKAEMAAYLAMGEGYISKRQFNEAILCGKTCLEIAKEIGDKDLEVDASLFIGDVYHMTNECDDAILFESKAIDIKKKINKMTPKENVFFVYSYSMAPNGIFMLYSFLHRGCIEKFLEIDGGFLLIINRIDNFLSDLYVGMTMAARCKAPKLQQKLEFVCGRSLLPYISAIGASKKLVPLFMSKPSQDDNKQFEQSLVDFLKDIALSSSTRKTMITLFILYGYHEAQNQHVQGIECLQKVLKLELGSLQSLINTHCYKKILELYLSVEFLQVPERREKITESYYHGLLHAKQCYYKHYEFGFLLALGYKNTLLGHLDLAKNHLRDAVTCSDNLFCMLRPAREQFAIQLFDKELSLSYKHLAEALILSNETQEALLVLDYCRARELKELLVSKYRCDGKETYKDFRQSLDIEALLSNNKCAIIFYSLKIQFLIAKSLYIFVAEGQKKIQFSTRYLNMILRVFMKALQREFDKMLGQEGTHCENRSFEKFKKAKHCGDEDDVEEEACESEDDDASSCNPRNQHDAKCLDINSLFEASKQDLTRENPAYTSNSAFEAIRHKLQSEKIGDVGQDGSLFDLGVKTKHFREACGMGRILMILYHKLFDNVSIEKDEIVIIPEGDLYSMPYSALRDPQTGKYLVETKRIRIAPSIEILNVLKQCAMEHHCKKSALVIGDPEVTGEVMYLGERKEFPALPFAAAEARVIASILGVKPMIGSQATKSAVIEALKQETAIIHIAAHGSLENATIVLSPSPETTAGKTIPDEEDYLLTMADVQSANLRSQLVVLSCCHSGRGEISTEGVVGMCRAFLAAGARAVLGSLWAISDDATLDFMSRFYSHLKHGKSASLSLQQTIKYVLQSQEYSDPMYWAPFFLFGDDVTINI